MSNLAMPATSRYPSFKPSSRWVLPTPLLPIEHRETGKFDSLERVDRFVRRD